MQADSFVGQKFGRLLVLAVYENGALSEATALCRCDCGKEKTFNLRSVRRGRSASCGCVAVERMRKGIRRTHGEADWRNGRRTPEYSTWIDMRWRCSSKNKQARAWYFERGITICERWNKFENFLADMGRRPEGMEIDRKDNDGPYSPENCRWVSKTVNVRNRSTTFFVQMGGKRICLSEAAKRLGISYHTLYDRLTKQNKSRILT